MTKNAGLWLLLLAIMTIMLSSCRGNSSNGEDFSESASEEAASQSETVSLTTTAEASETEVFHDEDVFIAVGEIEQEIAESEEPSFPVVTPADEVYEFYPMKIIYPEKQETEITAEKAEFNEKVYYEDTVLLNFSAEYPVFSGGNDAAMKKINDSIKAYLDEVFEEDCEFVKNSEPGEGTKEVVEIYGAVMQRAITGGGFWGYSADECYDINGNILSVYFINYGITVGAVHGHEIPVPMLFDIRTGDRIYFSDLVEDSDGLSEVLDAAFTDFEFAFGRVPFGELDADEYSAILEQNNKDRSVLGNVTMEFGTDEDGNYIVAMRNSNERMTVLNGCAAFYLAPYEYGSYADGIRRVDVPASEIIPFLNDKGKSLFEGYVSGSNVPANVVEYKGRKYFDTIMWIPNIIDKDNLTDEDREFVLLFKNIKQYILEYYKIEKD